MLKTPVDREVTKKLQTAAERISRGEIAAAEEILAEIWPNSALLLAESASEMRPASRVIREQIEQLPAERKARFWERVVRSPAEGSSPESFDLPTRAGYLAWRGAAMRHRDHGEFELALAAWRNAARHPAATADESAEAWIHAVESKSKITGGIVADDWRELIADKVRRRAIVIAGELTTIGDWLQKQSPPPVADSVSRPALTPHWSQRLMTPDSIEKGWRQASEELREQGVIRLPAAQSCVVGSRIIARTPEGLICLDAVSGETRWQIEEKWAHDRLAFAGQIVNPFFSGKLLTALVQQAQANTLAGDLSHDGRLVYQVIEAVLTVEPAAVVSRYALQAVDVETGRVRWRVGGAKPAEGEDIRYVDFTSNGAAAEFSVCGAPLVLDGHIFLLSLQSSDLVFQCINAETLNVEWSCLIGHLLPDTVRTSPQTYTAARMLWTGDVISCTTNCGVIAAVDPVRRQIRWMNRYPVELRTALRPEPNSADPIAAAVLHAWREGRIFCADGKLVTISPESPWLHVIDEQSGRMMARIPRGDGLTVLGVSKDSIVILEPMAVRAVAFNGRPVWRTVTGEVRGRGVVSDGRIVQPLADGSVAVLDARTGVRSFGKVRSDIAWGNLTPLPDGWLSADEFRVQMFAEWAADSPVDELDADLAELKRDPVTFLTIRERWQNRELKAEDRGELQWRLAEAATTQESWVDVVELGLDGLALNLQSERTMFGEATRRVRWDRAFQGAVSAALRAAPADEKSKLESALAAKWEATRSSEEPFGLQQLEHRWRGIPWTRRAALDTGESIFLGVGLFGRDLWLRSAMNSVRPETGLKAAQRLRDEWKNAGFDRDADDLNLRLLRKFAGAVDDTGLSMRRVLADDDQAADLLHRWNFGPVEAWPTTIPRVTPRNDAVEDGLQTPIPIHADADGIWDRMDVTIDRQGRTLRFTGNGERGAWSVALPKGPTPLQQYPITYQGWGLGRWLIVRIGTLLIAVSPWNEQGEPDARLIWSLDLIGPSLASQEQLIVERQLSTWKQAHEAFRILDPYGRDVGLVGPVRAGFLCYLRRGRLIAIETLTGRQLWERWDVPPGTIPLGDEDRVVLWTPERKLCEVLDAADGRTLAVHEMNLAREAAWHVSGCRVWSGEQGRNVTLFCRDLATNEWIWTRSFPVQSLPIDLDDQTGAVLDPHGLVHLLDLETGVTLDEPLTVELPATIERTIVCRDEFRWYLGVSGPVERSFDWISTQPLNSFRRPLLQGPLIAIDRSERQIVWRRNVSGEPWALDQPRSLPVLIQVFKQPPPVGGPAIGDGVIRLIDQRTGREIFTYSNLNLQPHSSLEPFPEFQKFELRLNNATFDVDYAIP